MTIPVVVTLSLYGAYVVDIAVFTCTAMLTSKYSFLLEDDDVLFAYMIPHALATIGSVVYLISNGRWHPKSANPLKSPELWGVVISIIARVTDFIFEFKFFRIWCECVSGMPLRQIEWETCIFDFGGLTLLVLILTLHAVFSLMNICVFSFYWIRVYEYEGTFQHLWYTVKTKLKIS